jgi:hypothetical protein
MPRGAEGGKSAADEEIQEFIFDVESTAKKILKKHNMKKQADAKRDRLRATRGNRDSPGRSGSGGFDMTGSGGEGSRLARAMLSKTMTATMIVPAEMPSAHGPSPDQPSLFYDSLGSSGGSLGKSGGARRVSAIPFELGASTTMAGSAAGQSSALLMSGSGGGSLGSSSGKQLPPLSASATAQLAVTRKLEASRLKSGKSLPSLASQRSAAASIKKLLKNPLASSLAASMGGAHAAKGVASQAALAASLKRTMAQLSGLGKQVAKTQGAHTCNTGGGGGRAEHDLEKRMCHACMTNPSKMTGSENGLRSLATAAEQSVELQGPVNWSSDDLTRKYRGELVRETAYEAYLLTREEAARREREEGVVLAVAEVERHAVFVMADALINMENGRARRRARARNGMKVFVLDVHRIWETNLGHVAPSELGASALKGIHGRRDVTSIEQGRSQLQSVSTVRALSGALESSGAEGAHARPRPDTSELQERARAVGVGVGAQRPAAGFDAQLPTPPELSRTLPDVPVAPGARACILSLHELRRERQEPLTRVSVYDVGTGLVHSTVLPSAFVKQTLAEHSAARARAEAVGGEAASEDAVAEAAALIEAGKSSPLAVVPPGAGRPVHRQGLRRGGAQLFAEVRLTEQQGQVVVVMDAFARAQGSRATQRTRVLHARATDVVAALAATPWGKGEDEGGAPLVPLKGPAKAAADRAKALGATPAGGGSLRPQTHAWWQEGHRATLWRHLVALLEVEDGGTRTWLRLEMPLDPEAAEPVRAPPRLWRRAAELAPLLSLQPAAPTAQQVQSGEAPGLELRFAGKESADADGGADWEAEAAPRVREQSLSLRTCGRAEFFGLVPGTTPAGQMGLGGILVYAQDEEHTQACAMFVRDPALSSTNSVLAMFCMALDTASLAPVMTAWIVESSTPEPIREPWPPGKTVVPRVLNKPATLMAYPVTSTLDTLCGQGIVVQCDVEDPLDYLADKLKAKLGGHKGAGHRRLWDEHDRSFFRQWAQHHIFDPNPIVSSRVFGVTARGAQPNSPGAHGRHNWHSEQRCVETLCKRRVEKDYAYISHQTRHQGANDPNTYSCMMQHEVVRELEASRLLDYLREHRRLQEAAKHKAEQEALKAKIEAGKAALAAKRKEQERIEAQLNTKEAKRIRRRGGKGPGKGGSVKEWAARISNSTLLREWEDWQERRCNETNTSFYHCTDAQLVQPTQWDPPAEWPHKSAHKAMLDALGTAEGSGSESEPDSGDEMAAVRAAVAAGGGGGGGRQSSRKLSQAHAANELTIESIVESLSADAGFLEKLKAKLGYAVSESDDEDVADDDSSEGEMSEDDDEEGGRSHQQGAGSMPTSLQQHHGDRRRDQLQEKAAADIAGIPPLSLDRMKANRGKGWRRLKKSFTRGLLSKAISTHTLPARVSQSSSLAACGMPFACLICSHHPPLRCTFSPPTRPTPSLACALTLQGEMANSTNSASLVGMVDPVEGCSYELPEQLIPVEVVLLKVRSLPQPKASPPPRPHRQPLLTRGSPCPHPPRTPRSPGYHGRHRAPGEAASRAHGHGDRRHGRRCGGRGRQREGEGSVAAQGAAFRQERQAGGTGGGARRGRAGGHGGRARQHAAHSRVPAGQQAVGEVLAAARREDERAVAERQHRTALLLLLQLRRARGVPQGPRCRRQLAQFRRPHVLRGHQCYCGRPDVNPHL